MSDYVGELWSLFVAGVALVSMVACALLSMSMSRRGPEGEPSGTLVQARIPAGFDADQLGR